MTICIYQVNGKYRIKFKSNEIEKQISGTCKDESTAQRWSTVH